MNLEDHALNLAKALEKDGRFDEEAGAIRVALEGSRAHLTHFAAQVLNACGSASAVIMANIGSFKDTAAGDALHALGAYLNQSLGLVKNQTSGVE